MGQNNRMLALERRTAFVLSLDARGEWCIVSHSHELPHDGGPVEIPLDKPLERSCDLCVVLLLEGEPLATQTLRGIAGATVVHISRPRATAGEDAIKVEVE